MERFDVAGASARTGTFAPADHRLAELLAALSERPRRIPSYWFYDEEGSRLFDRICELPEYYLTRTELGIMRAHGREIAAALGSEVALVEYGSGTSLKTRLLLEALDRPRAYVPVDVAAEHLEAAAAEIASEFPELGVVPLCADFTRPFRLPAAVQAGARRVAYFPGSTIGNFDAESARQLLADMRELVGPGGAALVGTDFRKEPRLLRAAYDDAAGVTAAFNRNVLRHLNDALGTDFDPDCFRHSAPWNEHAGRMEMYLVAVGRQVVHVAGRRLVIESGEQILTEYSHKYRPAEFAELAASAGWRVARTWTDPLRWFGVHLLEA